MVQFWYDDNNYHYDPTAYHSVHIGTHRNITQNLQSHLDDFRKSSIALSPCRTRGYAGPVWQPYHQAHMQ